MSKFQSRTLWQGLALAGIIAGSLASASTAFAGECPAGKMQANVREKVDYKPVGVTDVTLGSINLEKQPANIKDRELRFRKLTIEPGGIDMGHARLEFHGSLRKGRSGDRCERGGGNQCLGACHGGFPPVG